MTIETNPQEPGQETPVATLPGEGIHFKDLSFSLAVGIPITFGVLGLIEALGLLWRPIAIVLYSLLLLFSLFYMFGINNSKHLEKSGKENAEVTAFFIMTILIIVSFSQLGRHIYLQFGGFQADQAGYWHWLRFGIQNVLESILLDIPAIYEWNISEIQAITFGSKTLLFIFRTSLELFVITQLFQTVKLVKRTWKNSTSSQYAHFHKYIFSNLGRLIVLAIWSIPLSVGIGAIAKDGLSVQATLTVLKLGLPIILGVWLAWKSLVALFTVRGGWNKVLALVCILAGIWLVQANWSKFLLFIK